MSVIRKRSFLSFLPGDRDGGETATSAASESSLRPRFCRGPACTALFFVCSRCDRGERYCSSDCRTDARRRAANRRYQRTEPGRLGHLLRQRTYRQRRSCSGVTDQGSRLVTAPGVIRPSAVPKCSVCGCHSHWVDPFSPLRLRFKFRRWGRLPAKVQKSTFSDYR